jgi:hypothetical protein
MTSSMTPSPASAPLVFAEAQTLASPVVTEKILREMLLVKIKASEEELGKLSRQMAKQRKIEDTDHVEDEVIKFVPKTVTKK